MTHLDVHPEALLDREARGELSADELRHLDAHLAQCGACRLERQLRRDFDAELGAAARRDDAQHLVSNALLAAVSEASHAPEPKQPEPGARPSRRLAIALAATLLFASGLAVAQTEVAVRVMAMARAALGLVSAPAQREARSRSAPTRKKSSNVIATRAASVHPPRVEAALVEELAAPAKELSALPPSAAPTSAAGIDRRVAPGVSATSRSTRGRVESPSLQVREVAPIVQAPPLRAEPQSASALFEQASRARRAGQLDEARALYRELGRLYPNSPEALTALVVAARLDLDRGDARAALAGFDAYLATSARALREQALVGRAQVLRKLGLEQDERESLRALSAEYPDAPYLRAHEPPATGEP